MRVPSLLIATSRYTFRHQLYSRNQAMIGFLKRKGGFDFSKVTIVYPDHISRGYSNYSQTLEGGLEEIRFNLRPLRGNHPAIEPSYAASRIIPFFRRERRHYDYCIAADLTGWQLAYPLRKMGFVSYLIYDDQDYFPRVIKNRQGRLVSAGLEHLIARTSDCIISASETLAELRRLQGARRVRVVPNGVEPGFYNTHDEDAEGRLARRTILYAGYLDANYGVNLLLDAFSKLPKTLKASLVLAGTGPLETTLNRLLQSQEPESKIQLLGPVEHEELPKLMRNATLGVAPYLRGSSADYGIPLKVKEYLATGLPVVASAVGEIPGFFAGNHVGLTVRPNALELTDALSKILSLGSPEYKAVSDAAKRLAMRYSWDNLLTKYFEMIQEGAN